MVLSYQSTKDKYYTECSLLLWYGTASQCVQHKLQCQLFGQTTRSLNSHVVLSKSGSDWSPDHLSLGSRIDSKVNRHYVSSLSPSNKPRQHLMKMDKSKRELANKDQSAAKKLEVIVLGVNFGSKVNGAMEDGGNVNTAS